MQRQQERSRKYVGLTVNQHYLIDFLILSLDAETATLVRDFHGYGLRYREIAQRLYNECRIQVTVGAFNRIAGRLKKGREKILAAELSEADLENYPKIARKAILNILARYGPINDKDPKNGRPEMATAEEGTPSKDDSGPFLQPTTASDHPNSCIRCSGNMLFEEDSYGAYSTCLSCGYVYEPEIARLESLRRRRNPSHGGLPL